METFDYVVVGAGTAGCVVAARLSEQPGVTVVVIEAGGSDRRLWIQLPIGYGRTYFDGRINWKYDAETSPGLAGRPSYWPRGKVVGGSGSINAMVHVRGLPSDFDGWASRGNVGWGFEDVLPHFKASETFEGGEPSHRGTGGPMHVTDMRAQAHPLCGVFLKTAGALGFETTADFNGPRGEGVGIYQINTHRGRRDSTANAFLKPALRRGNLELRTEAQVTGLLFDGHRAVGVEYRQDGAVRGVTARREVILCGGSVNSPQLLQLSGVGDASTLRSLGIESRRHAPAVGQNLQDHLAVSYVYRSNRPTLNDELRPWTGKLSAGLRYLIDRSGPLSMSVNQGGGFVRGDPGQPRPNLQLYFSPVSYTGTPLAERRLTEPDPFSAFLLSLNACRPTSRGSVSIISADPFAYPEIRPNYLSTDHDVAEAIVGARLLRRLAATAPLNGVITGEIAPGAHVRGDDALLADFRARADTVYHPVGTCGMGPDPASSVVDARLRVHGIDGLRVIDASIMPSITSGNTNAPTVMIAHKGAAMVAEDARAGVR